ncbi:hypothetical protein [Leekyejoonella antrihumi]|uniref:Uncharacterized protein n=1 Tax=Leekyejoonella antrihumi TaxID=1660198 RepID=A0A563DRX3_9MICO|nr:hypothetical protein [Leekyejoonella antrihumi]TWP32713.1 hypothetical protein FGL98_23475 [Leekyejoonella antrihumi]
MPTLTLKVDGSGTLKITKITTTGTITGTAHAPTTLSTTVDSAVKIGYTITVVSISGKITSCTAGTPRGTKDIKPTFGACSITYTPGG